MGFLHNAKFIGAMVVGLTACIECRAESSFYCISADTTTIVTLFATPGFTITWTNATASNDYEIMRSDELTADWYPVTYGLATQYQIIRPIPTSRTYRIGFTPFPYDWPILPGLLAAVMSNVYNRIATNGDLICHHFDSGVPWVEAFSNQPYHSNVLNDLAFRKANSPTGHSLYLAITPLDPFRTNLAPYRAENENMALPPPWNTYPINHPNVQTAYLNYCTFMIDYFEPDHLIFGIEVNLLMSGNPSRWPEYLELHTNIYARLKALYPNLPISVSLTGMDLMEGYTSANHEQQVAAFQAITNTMDFFGLSLHAFLSSLTADTVPSTELIRSLFSLSEKPIAICETSYPAEWFTVYDGALIFRGTQEKQTQFFKNLFTVLDERPSLFVVNFITIDYDELWIDMGRPDDINKCWRDTGLYDGDLNPRDALRIWDGKLRLPVGN